MDDFMALIGAAPTDIEKQKMLAQLLSRRSQVGQIGALTGDKVLAPFGNTTIQQTDDWAKQLQQTRQNDIDDKRTQDYYTGQLDQARENARDRRTDDRMGWVLEAARIAAGIEEAKIRASAAGAKAGRKMTEAQRERIGAAASTYAGINKLQRDFSPDFTQIAGPGPQSLLPNVLSRHGLGTDKMDKAQNWWAGWQELRTLTGRYELFGATLTPNEKAEWLKVDINPGMSADQIQMGINRIRGIMRNAAQRRAKVMVADGFDPEQVMESFGEDLLLEHDEVEGDDDNPYAQDIQRIQQQIEAMQAGELEQ